MRKCGLSAVKLPAHVEKRAQKGMGRSEMAHTLGDTLRRAREDAGLSVRALSRMAGISPAQISQIEGGTRKTPGFPSVARLAVLLDLSLDEVADASGVVADLNRRSRGQTSSKNRNAMLEVRKVKGDVHDVAEQLDRVLKMLKKPDKAAKSRNAKRTRR